MTDEKSGEIFEVPICILCDKEKVMANSCMDATHLKGHQASLHKETMEKDLDFFLTAKRKKIEEGSIDDDETNENLSLNQKLKICSFIMAEEVAKCGLPYVICENFVKPVVKRIATTLYGEETAQIFSKIPASARTIQRRISRISDAIEENMVSDLKSSQWIALQLDESTDVSNNSVLVVFVRYRHENKAKEDLLFCKCLETTSTGLDVYNLISEYFTNKGLSWDKVCHISTDGAPAMKGHIIGFKACALKVGLKIQYWPFGYN